MATPPRTLAIELGGRVLFKPDGASTPIDLGRVTIPMRISFLVDPVEAERSDAFDDQGTPAR